MWARPHPFGSDPPPNPGGFTILLGTRYVGILTDGTDWILYHLEAGALRTVTALSLDEKLPDCDRLVSWLEAVMTTDTAIVPTPGEIRRRLGVESPAYLLDHATLTGLYESRKNDAEVALKRDLWAKLLRTAFGAGFQDRDQLFVDHTLLVVQAEIIAHAALGFDVSRAGQIEVSALTTGVLFSAAQIQGVVENDFFDWLLHVPGGPEFLRALADRLARFDWAHVEHDVLKVLYESVIEQTERQRLGEYYTPDWLADRMVAEHVLKPLEQRVLDPSCGSGTFLFHAVRAYLAAAEAGSVPNGIALDGVTAHVFGMDVHPVAVTLARVTYLLAIGRDRLTADDRGPLAIPVYLGDSMQWEQNAEYLSDDKSVTISTSGQDLVDGGGGGLWGDNLIFPKNVLQEAGRFDQLVSALTDKAADQSKKSASAVILPTLRNFGIDESDIGVLVQTFGVLRDLRRTGRNHIWGYYVRNLIRPLWLTEKNNRVDVLIGNPPWLRYARMLAPMQRRFTEMLKRRGLTTGSLGVSGRDLSTLFVVRCTELYAKPTARIAFVMPHGTLTRKPHDQFRSGNWTGEIGSLTVTMRTAWDLSQAATGFPMTSCVVSADITPGTYGRIPGEVENWVTSGSEADVSWPDMQRRLSVTTKHLKVTVESDLIPESPYKKRFRQGAILVPRALMFVNEVPAGPLGAGAGRVQVEARRSTQEKEPWKSVPTLKYPVEESFLRLVHLGETVLPYRTLESLHAVVPISASGDRILNPDEFGAYPALEAFWGAAQDLWDEHKKQSDESTLLERIDFHGQLSAQLPVAAQRVVYTKAGKIAAARVVDSSAVIDHKLYWASVSSEAEGRYLVGLLNSSAIRKESVPLQALGLFGARDLDKNVFTLPIRAYDPGNELHGQLASAVAQAEEVARQVPVDGMRFQRARTAVHDAVAAARIASIIDDLANRIITEHLPSR